MNRLTIQFRHQFLKRVVDVFAAIVITGGAGAISTVVDQKNKGIISVAKLAGVGEYKVTFGSSPNNVATPDTFVKLLNVAFSTVLAATSAVANVQVIDDQSGDGTKGWVTVRTVDFAGAAVNPVDTEKLNLVFTFNDSSAS